MATAIAETRADPVVVFRQTISQPAFREQLKMALPSHIPVERFERVATTAVQTNPSLLDPQKVERRSLFGALVRAAQDGLLPDGREGAIVPFKGKAQWMPMVAGIMAKVRRSGEIVSWDAFPVYEKDEFDYLLGDRPQIHHRPYTAGDPGEVTGAYSVVTFKDGSVSKDYLPRWRIEKARNQNPIGKNSLMWTTFYEEGAVKTVIRHHAKRLPQSTDIEALFERDETMSPPPSEPAPAAITAVPESRLDRLEQRIAEPAEIEAEAVEPEAVEHTPEGPDQSQLGESHNTEDDHPAVAKAQEIVSKLKRALNQERIDGIRRDHAADLESLPDDVRPGVDEAFEVAERRVAEAG